MIEVEEKQEAPQTYDEAAVALMQQMNLLAEAVESMRANNEHALSVEKFLAKRAILKQQAVVWEVNAALINAVHLLLMASQGEKRLLEEIRTALGVGVGARRDH